MDVEPPSGLQVAHLHDRIEVRLYSTNQARLFVSMGVALVAGGLGSTGLWGLLSADLGIPLSVGMLFLAGISAAATLRMALRALTQPTNTFVVNARGVSIDGEEILLADLKHCTVTGPVDAPYLILVDTYEEKKLAVRHCPQPTLEYLNALVQEAITAGRSREKTDGREYGVDRVAPEEIRQVAQRPETAAQ